MATEPGTIQETIHRFGPHRSYPSGVRLDTTGEPDKLVKTHCCFCGQQCGIQLKVKDNAVIGFEPWEEFPFNKGMLCPKGIRRYLQGAHPDRLADGLSNATRRPPVDFANLAIKRRFGASPTRSSEFKRRMAAMHSPCSAARVLPPRKRI